MSKLHATVINAHRPASGPVMYAQKGDLLSFERRPSEYEGWVWCEDDHGVEAWVPESWITVSGEGCRLDRDYVSRELTVEPGERVTYIEQESGWVWVIKDKGLQGWVPLSCLEFEDKHT
jgi:hypothetical protein